MNTNQVGDDNELQTDRSGIGSRLTRYFGGVLLFLLVFVGITWVVSLVMLFATPRENSSVVAILASLALLAALVTVPVYRYWLCRDSTMVARRVLSIILGVLLGLATTVIAFLLANIYILRGKVPGEVVFSAFWVAILLVIVVATWRPRVAFVAAIAAIAIMAVGIFAASHAQKRLVQQTKQRWADRGWPVDVMELSANWSHGDGCQEFVSVIRGVYELGGDQNEEFTRLCRRTYGDLTASLRSGADVNAEIVLSGIAGHGGFDDLVSLNQQALKGVGACSEIWDVDMAEYWREPGRQLPNMSFWFNWSRGMTVQAIVEASRGQISEALKIRDGLVEAADKVDRAALTVIHTLFSDIARLHAVEISAAIQELTWSPVAMPKIDWSMKSLVMNSIGVAPVFHEAGIQTLEICESAPELLRPPIPGFQAGIFDLGFEQFRRASVWRDCAHDIEHYERLHLWMIDVRSEEPGRFGWMDYRNHFLRSGARDGMIGYYPKFLRTEAFVRISTAINLVLEHSRSFDELPGPEIVRSEEWPLDPFDENPIRYRLVSPVSFVVYSVGPDENDQEGRDLWPGGIFDESAEQDLGFHLRRRAPLVQLTAVN